MYGKRYGKTTEPEYLKTGRRRWHEIQSEEREETNETVAKFIADTAIQ
jgi:hypothetical protein